MAVKKKKTPQGRLTSLREKTAKLPGAGKDALVHMTEVFDATKVLPMEHIALQYLLGITGVPLGRAMTLVGPPGTGKSSLGHYFASLFIKADGVYGFVDTEQKTNMEQVQGIMHNVLKDVALKQDGEERTGINLFKKNFLPFKANSQEDMLVKQTHIGENLCAANVDCGAFPWVLNTDSINYLMPEEFQDKVVNKKDNSAPGFVHMHKANKLQSFLGSFIPRCINDYPALFIAINHQKEKTEQKGAMTITSSHEAGGVFKDFLWSYNIEFKKGSWLNHNSSAKKQGIILKSKKSTGSENGRKIGVGMITTQRVDEQGHVVGLEVAFDWSTTLAELIAGKPKWDANNSVASQAYRDEIGFKKISATSYTCTAVGLKEVSPREVGDALQAKCLEDEEFGRRLMKELWIFEAPVFDPKTWTPPDTDTMSVAEAREILGEGDL